MVRQAIIPENVDLINLKAIETLESLGNKAPTETQIQYMETLLRLLQKVHPVFSAWANVSNTATIECS